MRIICSNLGLGKVLAASIITIILFGGGLTAAFFFNNNPSLSPSPTPSPSPTSLITPTPSISPSPNPTNTPTPNPSASPTSTPIPTTTVTPTPTPTPEPTPTPTPEPTPTPTPDNATQEAIDDVIPQIESNISWFLSDMEDDLPRNPLNSVQIQEKIDMLSEPDLAENIVNQGLFVVDFFLSIDGRNIPIVAVFPRNYMREDVVYEVYRTKLALPILENFFDMPVQRNWIHVWYGFRVGNLGGGGSVYCEDRATYESRFREGMLPYDLMLYHELGHSYIGHESLNQFLEVYLFNFINTGSLNFEDWTIHRTPPENWPWITAILDIYRLIGHDAMAEAYKVIYSYNPPYGTLLSQECKQAFVDNAPESLKSQVSVLAEIIEY